MTWPQFRETGLGETPEAADRFRVFITQWENLAGREGVDHTLRLDHIAHLRHCLKELEQALERKKE